jgi:hypothetical protein
MRWIAFPAAVTLAALAGGCTGAVRTSPPGADHPGNPAAVEAPAPAPTTTLAVRTPVTSGPEVEGVVPPQVGDPGGSGHAGHAGHAMPAHGMPMARSASAPATAPAGTLYACPMHPKVTSTDPNARCPECTMKINKPVVAATAPATRPTAPAAGPGHDHDHGGMNK